MRTCLIGLFLLFFGSSVTAQHSGLEYYSIGRKTVRIPLNKDIVILRPGAHNLHAKLIAVGDSVFIVDRLGRVEQHSSFGFGNGITVRSRQPLRYTAGGLLLGGGLLSAGYAMLYRAISSGPLNGYDKRALQIATYGSITGIAGSVFCFYSVRFTLSRPGTIRFYDEEKKDPERKTGADTIFPRPYKKPLNYLYFDIGSLHTAGLYYDRHQQVSRLFFLVGRAGYAFEPNGGMPVLGLGLTTRNRIAPELLAEVNYAGPSLRRYYHEPDAVHVALVLGVTGHLNRHIFIRPNAYWYLGKTWVMGGPSTGIGVSLGGCF